MSQITVEKMTKEEARAQYGIDSWSPWECEPSEFDWEYSSTEKAYVFEGKVKLAAEDGEVAEFEGGCFVTFAQGLKCKWQVLEKVRKVYKFE